MWYSGFLLCLLALAACFLPRASAGCSPGDMQQLQQCLAPIHPLLNQPHLPSQKTCRIILGFISCVEKKKRFCLDFIRNTRVLDIAKNLQLRYCVSPWSVTTTTVPPPTVHELFSNCREHYSGRNHRTLEEACRWANSFLECGQEVLWSSDFSTDTFQLHAELLRNRAVYLRHCARVALLQGGVGRGRCPHDVTSRLTSCINITYWQPVARGDVKTFCRTVPQFLPCLSDLANGCHHVSLLRDMADFLWNSFDLLSVECSKLGPVRTELDYDYDDYEDEQQEQISSTLDTKSTQLHKAETKPTQLYDAEKKPTHLHKTETKPTHLHKAETKPPHLHKAETKPTHLHKAETQPTHLPKAETKPKPLHKTETKPTHLHKTETKIAPESPGPPRIQLSASERDFKTVTKPSQARGRQQNKQQIERTTTLVQPEQTQSGSFNSNSGETNEPQNTFQEEKGNRKFVSKSKQERRETFKETPHSANDLTSQGKSRHGGDQRSECNDNSEKDPECNDAGEKHPKCNGKDNRRRATNGSKRKHNLPPCHSENPNGKDTEYINVGSHSNHQDNEDSRVGSNKHDQLNEDTRLGSNKHDQNNEDFRVESNEHDQDNGDSRVGSSKQNPMGKKQRKQKVRTNGTKQQLLKSSSKNNRRTSFSTKHRPQTSTIVSPPKSSSEVIDSSPKAVTKPVVSPPEASTKLAGSPSNVSTKHLSRVPLNRPPDASATTTTLRNQHKSFILRKITAAVTASSPTTPEGPRKTVRPTERTSSVSVALSKGKKLFTRGSVGDFSPASQAVTVEEGVSQEEVEEGVGEEETEEGVNEEDVKEKVSEEEVKAEVIQQEVEEGVSQEKQDVLKPTTHQGNRSDLPSNWSSPGPRSPTGLRPADLDKEADAEPGVSPNPAPEGGVVTTLHSWATPSSLTSTLWGRVSSSITPRSYSSHKSSHPTSPSLYYDDDDKLPTVLTVVAPNRDGRGDSGGVNAPVLVENGKDPKATLAPTAILTMFSAAESESAGDRTGVRNAEHAPRQSEDNKADSLSAESRPQFQSPSSTVSTRSPNSSNKQSSLASSTSAPTASEHIHQQEPVSEKAAVLEPNPAQEEDLLEPDPTQEEPNPNRHGPDVTKAVEGDKNSADKASRSSQDQNGTLSGDVKTADIADNLGLHSVQLPHVTADQRTETDEDRPTNRETDPKDGGQYLANSGQRGPRGTELPDSLRGFAPTRLADTEETTVYEPTARPNSKRRPEKRRYDHLNTDSESGNKTERDTDVKLDTKEKPETKEDPGTEVEAGIEVGIDTQPEPGREAEADGQAEADRKGEAETEADRKAAAETEADSKGEAETEADRKAAVETEADSKGVAETEAEWDMERAAERKDGPGAGRPTLATSFSGQPSGGTGGGTARATPVYHTHDQAPPWGQDCSQPWKGHNWCTSIIMHARLGSPAEECRSLRHYIGCLRRLQRACRDFQPFESISGTVDYITSVFQYKCPAYSVHNQGPA